MFASDFIKKLFSKYTVDSCWCWTKGDYINSRLWLPTLHWIQPFFPLFLMYTFPETSHICVVKLKGQNSSANFPGCCLTYTYKVCHRMSCSSLLGNASRTVSNLSCQEDSAFLKCSKAFWIKQIFFFFAWWVSKYHRADIHLAPCERRI